MQYKEQINNYCFTPEEDGKYSFSFVLEEEMNLELHIIDDNGTPKVGDSGMTGEETVLVNLNGGETYIVRVQQETNLGAYSLMVQ